jgi:hypothetical protein
LLKIFLFKPARRFVRVSLPCPSPQNVEDDVVDVVENTFRNHVPMIVRPTTHLGVELINQVGRGHVKPGLDSFSDSVQEGLDVLLGGFNEQFPIRISAHVLSEKVEASCHVRDDGLFRGKFQPTFAQKLLDERLDFPFQ